MRIAFYHNLGSGGAKRAIYEVITRLSTRHDIDLYSLSSADHEFCDIRPFVRNHYTFDFFPGKFYQSPYGRLNQYIRYLDLNRVDSLSKVIASEIDKRKYDLVYAHPCIFSQAPTLLRYVKTRSIYLVYESLRSIYETRIQRTYQKNKIKGWVDHIDPLIYLYKKRLAYLDRVSLQNASELLSISQFTADNVLKNYGRKSKVNYLGVDTNVFRPIKCIDSHKYILSVGAIAPHKGFSIIIEALSVLPKNKRPELRIIGNVANHDEKKYLEQLAMDMEITLVVETMVDQDTLVKRYNEAQFIVYTPIREPFGLVPLEAMACGKPVIGVNEGGVCETVLDGVTGTLVERDIPSLAKIIQEYNENQELVFRLGRQARDFTLEKWTWDKSVNRLEEYFNSLLIP